MKYEIMTFLLFEEVAFVLYNTVVQYSSEITAQYNEYCTLCNNGVYSTLQISKQSALSSLLAFAFFSVGKRKK